ncbi:MAG: alpha/beta hydrolase family protein [Eubacteriales bacterium]
MAVLSINYYSQARKGFTSFTAILPTDPPPIENKPIEYLQGPFPTIYLLHGYSGNRLDWLMRTRIEEWAASKGYAVVMPDGANRFYLDNAVTGELYGSFVAEELVEVTRKMFPLSHKKEDTVIAGLSMGGYGALRNGLKYNDTFGAIIALSSALITDMITEMKPGDKDPIASYEYYNHTFGELKKLPGSDKDPKHLAKIAGENRPRIFLACGKEDFLVECNIDYHEHLESIGYAHEWWYENGVHDFDFWNKSMRAALEWLKKQN